MTEYKIIQSDDLFSFEKLVEEAMKDGWQPQGGVSVLSSFKILYFQAMVK